MKKTSTSSYAYGALLSAVALWAGSPTSAHAATGSIVEDHAATEENAMQVHYLEIVTTQVEETCAAMEAQHGVSFSDPIAELGNARVAAMKDGGRIGVRAPMAEHDLPIVRPYMLVEDIEAASAAAEDAGAEFAMRTTEVPGQGKFAIYFLGGIQYGLWEH